MDRLWVEKYSPTLCSPLYVVGLAGPSDFGRITAKMLIDRVGARLFGELYSRHFPDHVTIEEDGTCRLLRYEFFESSLSSPNMLIACGDDGINFENPESAFDVLDEIVQLGKKYRSSTLILVDALHLEDGELTLVAATTRQITKNLEGGGAKVLKEIHLLGPAGIILGMCRLYSLSAVGIFPTLTRPEIGVHAEETLKLIEESFNLQYPEKTTL